MSQYPNVKITLKEGNTKEIEAMIESGSIDIGFVEGFVSSTDIIKEQVSIDELLIVTADEKLSQIEDLEELRHHKWILREEGSGTREVFLEYIKDRVDNLNIFLELGHTESIKSLLRVY